MTQRNIIRRVLISLEIPGLQPWNRFSAVACVVCSFAEVLHNGGYDVFINQHPFEDVRKRILAEDSPHTTATPRPFGGWHRLVPKRAREAVKDVRLLRHLRRLLVEVKTIPRPDVIISWISYASDNGRRLAQHWSVPLVGIYDNPLVEEYEYLFGFKPALRRLVDRREKSMVTHAQRLIVYSEAMAEHLQRRYAMPLRTEIRQFIDRYKIIYTEPRAVDGPLQLLFIGSFFRWHRVDLLVDVFARIAGRHPSARLCLVGAGPEESVLRRHVEEKGLADAVTFAGRQDKTGLDRIVRESHVGIIPNALWFHAPVKLFQYAAAGLCVVARRTPTLQEIADDCPGAFELFDTADDLAAHLEQLLVNPSLVGVHGRRGYDFVTAAYGDQAYLAFFARLFASLV